MPYLEAYNELTERRPEGMSSLQPIPINEIERWAYHFWPLSVRRLVRFTLKLDAAHRRFIAERARKESGDAQDRPQGAGG